MTCDVQELLIPCFTTLNAREIETVQTALLCQILNHLQTGDPVTCDVQTLLDNGKCFAEMGPGYMPYLQLQILCNIVNYLNDGTPGTCDPQELLDDAKCFISGVRTELVPAVHAALLCEVANALP